MKNRFTKQNTNVFGKFTFILLNFFLLSVDGSLAQSSNFFYSFISGDYTFNKRNDDGTNPVTVYTPSAYQINASAVDGSISKVFFWETTSNIIFKSDYNGSNRTTAFTTSGQTTSIAAGNGYIFYAYLNSPYSVRRCSSTGSGDTQLYLNPAYGNVFCLAFDAADNYLYYYEGSYNASSQNRIFRTDINGGNMVVVYNNCPPILSLAAGGGYVYYALNNGTYALYRRTSTGGSETAIYTPSTGSVNACTYDAVINKIFFYDTNVSGSKVIYKADPDGSNRTSVYGGFSQNLKSLSSPTAIPVVAPTVTTQAVSSVVVTTATGNGSVSATGGANITERGIYYSTTNNFVNGTGTKLSTTGNWSATGAFTQAITGLTAGTTYYLKAFATNSGGTGYGDQVTFTTLTNGTFTGASSNDWNTAGNWAGGSVPTSATDVIIPSDKNPVISATTQASCNNLSVSGTLAVQSSASGTGSLIASGSATGNVNAERYLTSGKWHVVSPIVGTQTVAAFLTANAAIPTQTTSRGMMDYNTSTNVWNSYYPTSGASGTMDAGKGYSMRVSTDAVVTFTGTLTTGSKTISLTKFSEDNSWNCVGNPYTSAIGVNADASSTENFITKNVGILDASYACIYVWDEDASYTGQNCYKIISNTGFSLPGKTNISQNYIAPGQGFFVKARANATNITFTAAMQSHQPSVAFKSAEMSWPGFELNATTGDVKASAIVAFNNQMTKGLDITYDAGLLRGTNGLSLYTRLVDDNGVDFAIQCLPESGAEQMVIPVGLESKVGGEVRFSAATTSLPAGCNVLLEDRVAKTVTDLSDGKEMVATVSANAAGTGRFYLHLSKLTTGNNLTPEASFNLKAYVSGEQIVIEGNVSGQAKAGLYDSKGSQLGLYNLEEGNRNAIPATGLSSGVYILKVTDGKDAFSIKLVKNNN